MSVTAALRVIIPLAVGGVMAGAIAIGANGGGAAHRTHRLYKQRRRHRR
ncbi:MAG TPA: hypothetical protein VI759_06080 [Dehalococcoidia bacterium]|nr:hypothetical protein [Dehalococcoidia bacterium]